MTSFKGCSDVTEKELIIKFYKTCKYVFLSKESERLNGTEHEWLQDRVYKNDILEVKTGLQQEINSKSLSLRVSWNSITVTEYPKVPPRYLAIHSSFSSVHVLIGPTASLALQSSPNIRQQFYSTRHKVRPEHGQESKMPLSPRMSQEHCRINEHAVAHHHTQALLFLSVALQANLKHFSQTSLQYIYTL